MSIRFPPVKLATLALVAWQCFFPTYYQLYEARADEMIQGANEGQTLGLELLGRAANPATFQYGHAHTADPDNVPTSGFNVPDYIPGAQRQHFKESAYFSDNPALREPTRNAHFGLSETGCRATTATFIRNSRVLRVVAYERRLEPLFDAEGNALLYPSGAPRYEEVDTPAALEEGVDIQFPTLGYSDSEERIIRVPAPTAPGYVVVYQKTPFAGALDGTLFTTNHTLTGGGGAITHYGELTDGFTTVGAASSASMVLELYADLYEVARTYAEAEEGVPCPDDPPGCLLGGVDLCAPSNSGVLAGIFQTGTRNDTIAYDILSQGHRDNPSNVYEADARDITAATEPYLGAGNPELSDFFSGCTSVTTETVDQRVFREPDIRTCSNALFALEENGCDGQREVAFEYIGSRTVLTVTATWEGRDCALEANTFESTCRTGCATELPTCIQDCAGDPVCEGNCQERWNFCQSCDQGYNFCMSRCAQIVDATERAACEANCPNRRDLCISTHYDCPLQRADFEAECDAWNAANANEPFDLTGHTFSGGDITVGDAFTQTYTIASDPSGAVLTKEVTPFPGVPTDFFTTSHQLVSATGTIDSYGCPSDNWTTAGTATVTSGNTFHVVADGYRVVQNDITGCENYLNYVADGWCDGVGSCTDYRGPCTTIDGVSFCSDSGPGQCMTELLKPWQTEAVSPDVDGCSTGVTTPDFVPLIDPMCWAAHGDPMQCNFLDGLECWTDIEGNEVCGRADGTTMVHHFGDERYRDDCLARGLMDNPDCTLVSTDTCVDCATGAVSGLCYMYEIRYDCGQDHSYEVPGGSSTTQVCDAGIRCMGNECHNVVTESSGDFVQAATVLQALNFVQHDVTCLEGPEFDPNSGCTVVVFNGEARKCKIPIGSGAGLTPNCCAEGKEAASGIEEFEYLKLTYFLYKASQNEIVANFLASIPGYSGYTTFVEGASGAVDKGLTAISQPFTDALSNVAQKFGWDTMTKGGADAAQQAGVLGTFKTKIMESAYHVVQQLFPGLEEILFSVTKDGVGNITTIAFAMPIQMVFLAYQIYSILKLIGHLVFRCTDKELELGIQRKFGNCHYVGSYCAKDTFFGVCIKRERSYCCYNSPLSRIIGAQVREQLGGFGRAKKPNCQGITPAEFTSVNWSLVDLNEWEWRLAEAGLIPGTQEGFQEMFGINQSRSLPAIGQTAPGPDGEMPRAPHFATHYGGMADDIDAARSALEEAPTCFAEDPADMAWYGYLKPGEPLPDVSECFGP